MQITITEPLLHSTYKTKRVAAYSRVSSKKQAQLHSLESQKDYFERALALNPDYLFVGSYVDRGISGTKENRPEFQRLMADCRKGLVDVVITKSITRFARNTEVFLESIRELTSLGIDVYFEKENIHTIGKSELELTLRAQYAEEESCSVSENQKWKIRTNFQNGIPNNGRMLGYRLKEGELELQEDEVEVVRLIFNSYLSGMGLAAIAKLMNRKGYRTINGRPWDTSALGNIIRNEKYTGDMILQKTYRKDYRNHDKLVNQGELRKYEIQGSHEPIISREMFQAVQEEIARRSKINREIMQEVPDEKHLFTGYIICRHCGWKYGYYNNSNRKNPSKKPKWRCTLSKLKGKEACPAKAVPEEVLIAQTQKVLEKAGIAMEDKTTFTEHLPDYLEKYVDHITVSGDRELTFHLKDGTIHIVAWKYESRSKSWTPEMRQRAREKSLAIAAEKRKKSKEEKYDKETK